MWHFLFLDRYAKNGMVDFIIFNWNFCWFDLYTAVKDRCVKCDNVNMLSAILSYLSRGMEKRANNVNDTVASLRWIMCDLIGIIMIAWPVVSSSSIYRWLIIPNRASACFIENGEHSHWAKHLISISAIFLKSQNIFFLIIYTASERKWLRIILNTFKWH